MLHPRSLTDSPIRSGKVKMGVLLWALGVPIPFVLLFLLLRGCS